MSHQKGHPGSLENIPYADGTEEADGHYEKLEEVDSIASHHNSSGRDYVAHKYPDLTIIDGRYFRRTNEPHWGKTGLGFLSRSDIDLVRKLLEVVRFLKLHL